MTLYVRRHLHSDSGSIVKVLQHVMALRVFDQPPEGFFHGEPAGPTVGVVKRGTFNPDCGNKRDTTG